MNNYILISVSERNIETKYFSEYETAYEIMVKELDKTGNREEHSEDNDYGLDKLSAWSNMSHNCNCDWKIEKLPGVGVVNRSVNKLPPGCVITSSKHISEVVKGDLTIKHDNAIIAATSDAYLTDTGNGREWNFECSNEYFYASEFDDGIVEIVTLVQDDAYKLHIPYVSVWDGGTVIKSNAKVDIRTGEVTDIESVNAENLEICEREYINMNDKEVNVYTDMNGYRYWADLKYIFM